eukprot:4961538-Prymnesium_polylepis.3
MRSPFLQLNTTVFFSLNTSSRAAANYDPPPYGTVRSCQARTRRRRPLMRLGGGGLFSIHRARWPRPYT